MDSLKASLTQGHFEPTSITVYLEVLQNHMDAAYLGNAYLITVMDPGANEKDFSKEVQDLL